MFRSDIDLLESFEGDIILDGGDLADTSENPGQTYYQMIRFALNTSKHECLLFPDTGVSIKQFMGMPNTKQNGLNMAKSIKNDLADSTVIYKPEIEVTPFPVGKNTIAFRINLLTVQGSPMTIALDTTSSTVSTLR